MLTGGPRPVEQRHWDRARSQHWKTQQAHIQPSTTETEDSYNLENCKFTARQKAEVTKYLAEVQDDGEAFGAEHGSGDPARDYVPAEFVSGHGFEATEGYVTAEESSISDIHGIMDNQREQQTTHGTSYCNDFVDNSSSSSHDLSHRVAQEAAHEIPGEYAYNETSTSPHTSALNGLGAHGKSSSISGQGGVSYELLESENGLDYETCTCYSISSYCMCVAHRFQSAHNHGPSSAAWWLNGSF